MAIGKWNFVEADHPGHASSSGVPGLSYVAC